LEAERRFEPELGNTFWTFAQWHLKGLHRLIQADRDQIKIPEEEREAEAAAEARQKAEEAGEPIRPVIFAGGNGTRITIDRQWNSNNSFNCRHRIILGVQLHATDEIHSRGVIERISADLPAVINNQPANSIRLGFWRAMVDMAECRQRETDQEAENQKGGDFSPVFLETRRLHLDIGLYKGRKPPNLRERTGRGIIYVSLDEVIGEDEDGNPLRLKDVIADGSGAHDPNAGEDVARLLEAIQTERPFLSDKEAKVLAWKLNPQGLTLSQFAAKEGLSKGYASKMSKRIEGNLAKRFKR
jgi:hypothetical protein